jgi:hypothetical protein
MRNHFILVLLVLCAPLAGCGKLNERDVRQFVDRADDTARKLYAPHICELRGKNFVMHVRFQGDDVRIPSGEFDISRKTFCIEAGKNAWLRHYKLERRSLDIDLAPDRKTAHVTAEYIETLPWFEPDIRPASPFDFREVQVLETRDDSIVGIEGGDIVFLSTNAEIHQTLVPKGSIDLPVVN